MDRHDSSYAGASPGLRPAATVTGDPEKRPFATEAGAVGLEDDGPDDACVAQNRSGDFEPREDAAHDPSFADLGGRDEGPWAEQLEAGSTRVEPLEPSASPVEPRPTRILGAGRRPGVKRKGLRVAHLSSSRTSGTITAKYAQALVDVGAEVHIFSPHAIGARELQQGLVPTSAPAVILPFGKRALLRREYYLSRLRLLTMAPDVIIAEDPELLNFATKYARATGARLVYMPFEYYPGASYATPKLERRWHRIERRCSPSVAAWIVLGDKVAELYAGVLAPAEAVHVVYAGWPRTNAGGPPKLRRTLGVGPEVKLLLYQGSVQEKRGLWDVLDAMPLLPSYVHFAVLGMGELGRLRKDAAARGLAGRVHILEAVPQAELIDYTKDADIGLIPIRNTCVSYDLCSPGKIFEYIAAGLPLAVSRLTQLEWFVTRHGLGEVFDLESPAALARSVLRLLEDDAYREECRRQCRHLQETEVCWEIQVEELRRAVLGPHYPERAPLHGDG